MEKIKVNMSPNPLDVQTIHASQNDGEARQWEFELHNNGELIDTSEVTEQMFFKAYKGGTEQLLPENTSTPTTSPFLGDIRYPKGLLTDQEFTYRQSPTEEDGNAKITDIKGNTLGWNQLVNNGNFADTSAWGKYLATLTVSGNVGTVTATGRNGGASQNITVPVGHVLLFIVTAQSYTNSNTTCQIRNVVGGSVTNTHQVTLSTTKKTYALMHTVSANTSYVQIVVGHDGNESGWSGIKISNAMLIDLTMLNASYITGYNSFKSYFPLSYYSYNQGSLLSFNGNGIKTVGKNQFKLNPSATSSNIINDINETTGAVDVADTTAIRWSTPYIGYTDVIVGKTYTASLKDGVVLKYGRIGGSTTTSQPTSSNQPNTSIDGAISSLITNVTPSRTFVANETQRIYWYYCTDSGNANHQEFTFYLQIELDSTASDFEPYTSSTLSLPISTYFPNGMASAKNAYSNTMVYDELLPTKAIKRLVQYTFTGNETVSGITNLGTYYRCYISIAIPSKGTYATIWEKNVPNVYNYTDDSSHYYVQNSQFWYFTTSSTEQAIRNELNGTKFYYDLATPTETSFTTASLVTENAEIPLSNEDGTLIGKCTEQLSENPGFIDAKIKLSDADGTCYSNKLQLHVERSPQ